MTDVRTTDNGEAEYTQPRNEAAEETGQAECSGVDITVAKNGGFSVRKQYRQKSGNGPYMESDTFAFSSFPELVAFLQQTFGAGAPAEPQTESAAPPMAPAAAAA